MATNKKMVMAGSGTEVKSWEVDIDVMTHAIRWVQEHPDLAQQEVEEMELHFPMFIATIASGNKAISCSRCGEILVWNDGIRCVACNKPFVPRMASQLCCIGQIPSIIGEVNTNGQFIRGKCRPFFRRIYPRIRKLPANERRYFFSVGPGGEAGENIIFYFSPVVYGIYPDNWNRDMPTILLEDEYFRLLGIPTEHVFPDHYAQGYKLCNYASWPRVTLRVTLQQRIVPRIIMDLMLADLQSVGRLHEALGNMGTNTHSVYNIIGRGGRQSRAFEREYNIHVKL